MSRRNSISSKAAVATLALLLPRLAHAQACCAGVGAVTPGRLAMHEDALVAVQVKADQVFGSFDSKGHYSTPPSGTSEQNFEQDLIGSYRIPILPDMQVALQLPIVENRRSAHDVTKFGGALGDLNLALRYDFLYSGMRKWVPGIALLGGITFPTGRAPEQAHDTVLATDATGIGAFQGNLGINIEQLFGKWLVSIYGIVAKRAARTAYEGTPNETRTELGTQWTALAAVAYSLPHDYAVAASISYTGEGDAEIAGQDSTDSARRVPVIAVSGVIPFSDHFRLQAAVNMNPPIPSLGKNQPANAGLALTALYAWY